MSAEYVLEMKNITKHYGENTVLSDVSLSVRPGEIHALLGENGAGLSMGIFKYSSVFCQGQHSVQ